MTLEFDLLFHNPNPAIDDYLHGDQTHTDEDGNEVTHPGTPDRDPVIVIEPEPDPEPEPNPEPERDYTPQTNRGGPGLELHGQGVSGAELQSQEQTHLGTGDGATLLIGGTGNDRLISFGAEYNLLDGGPGDDTLIGASGIEVMIGGLGRDHFDVSSSGIDHVKIMDFQDGVDKIRLGRDDSPLGDFYKLLRHEGKWDMEYIATDNDNDVVLQLQNDDTITIVNTDLAALQMEVVGNDLFIV